MVAASHSASAYEQAALSAVTMRLRAFPRHIGRYRIIGRLGEGGMGSVYAGLDPDLERRVAIKLLAKPIAPSARARIRMLREAQALGAISHPNVVAIYEVGVHEDAPFIAMEHVDAHTLKDWMRGDRTWRQILDVFYQCAAGLAAAHARGIVHRDFKPSNVLVSKEGRARVLDFGLARLVQDDEEEAPTDPMMSIDVASQSITLTGAVVGTPGYMAPEQHIGGLVGPGADQYAFCVAMWEALHGLRPYAGSSSSEFLAAIRRAKPLRDHVPSGMPRAIATVLRRGMRLEPRRRHPSMEALVLELREAARHPSPRGLAVGALLLAGTAVAGSLAFGHTSSIDRVIAREALRTKQDLGEIARLSRALAVAEANIGRDSAAYARVAYELASVYAAYGRFDEAARVVQGLSEHPRDPGTMRRW